MTAYLKNVFTSRFVTTLLAAILAALSVTFLAYATTIGNDVSVAGTLTVTGASTFTGAVTANGAVTLGDAAADTITVNGRFAGFVSTASSTVDGALTVSGAMNASSTLQATGVTRLYGNVHLGDAASDTITVNGVFGGFVSNASSTVSSGVFNIGSGSFGVATSSPGQEVGIVGDILQTSTGTTTLDLDSTGTGKGSCIQMLATDGTLYRVYAAATTSNSGQLIVESGRCQ